MTACVTEIWRHPIKSHGRERVASVTLTEGQALPFDRTWAVAHERSRFDATRPDWQPCTEFSIGSKSPRLQAIALRRDATDGRLTLSHPDRAPITIDPDDETDAARFIDWVVPISNPDRMLPSRLVRAPQAMTDTGYASVSLINLASHRAVETQLGRTLSPLRWRGNLLVEGLEPWAEMGWIGCRLRLGSALAEVVAPITRCMATTANPETGQRDADTLKALKFGFGHQDCGVYLRIIQGGTLADGDPVEVLN
jgi:uncharacterized protein YcbX